MASSPSHKKSKNSTEAIDQDRISNMPDIVTEEILKRLSITMAAKMSLLSRQWRLNWLSHPYLIFDIPFWDEHRKDGKYNWEYYSNIISNTLFHNRGQIIHVFVLHIPVQSNSLISLNISQWLSFLARTCAKNIIIQNRRLSDPYMTMSSHIFLCKDLMTLSLWIFCLYPPPIDFTGFANLRTIELIYIEFKDDAFRSLIKHCPKLAELVLIRCRWPRPLIVIEAPYLKSLTIRGKFEFLHLLNLRCLDHMTLRLEDNSETPLKAEIVRSFRVLLSSYDLQYLELNGRLCKFLAGCDIGKSFRIELNNLQRLRLMEIDLNEVEVFCFAIGLVQSSPLLQDLEISVKSSMSNDVQHQSDQYCNTNYTLFRLLTVKITGITGSSSELKLIEYLLAISMVLEKLFFKCEKLDATSELKVSRQLMRFARASTKAQLVCLDK